MHYLCSEDNYCVYQTITDMKKHMRLLLLAVMLCSGSVLCSAGTPINASDSVVTEVSRNPDGTPKRITVRVIRRGKTAQKMVTAYWLEAQPSNGDEVGKVSRADINFDGHSDIVVYLGEYSNRGYNYYDAWVWSRRQQRYVHVQKYHEIANAEVNAAEKCIESTSAVSFSEEVYNRYKWQRGKLILAETRPVENND